MVVSDVCTTKNYICVNFNSTHNFVPLIIHPTNFLKKNMIVDILAGIVQT